jgi:hypothetical protein
VDDETASREAGEGVAQRQGTLVGVELADAPVPLRSEHPRRLVGTGRGAAGDDELVVAQRAPVDERDLAGLRVDAVDVAEHELDAVRDEGVPAASDLLRLDEPERQEEVARLVVVDVVLVDDGDAPLGGGEAVPQLVHDHGAGRARSQHHERPHGGGQAQKEPPWG